MGVEQRVRALAEEKIADRPDLFIVEIKVINNTKIIILLDGDNGVGIHDCAMVSRHVGYHLEEENLLDHAYNLEVSSPGLDTPLILDRQFAKNIGRNVTVKHLTGDKLEGKLLAADEESITVAHQVKAKGVKTKKAELVESKILKNSIAEVKVSVSFK
ncbi:ribosome assembly cofactor RimP [Pedobacter puniceum]|jgi:ribosome maturation factor RimP|uniref:Ribosome maturation factor RimP n=1 Tax=Pedobacter puniceum TaxID=2666136 RepID=A0A7K0FP36_9SPHI|nr:ribosome assembly cofactor RimP [Pedobacter puniceum]MRX47401.1 ribosome assembly cofactor RimP [Pedobacter puniceum]